MAEEMERQREQLESQWAAKMSKREAGRLCGVA